MTEAPDDVESPLDWLRLGCLYLLALVVPPWLLGAAVAVQVWPPWRELAWDHKAAVGLAASGAALLLAGGVVLAVALAIRGAGRVVGWNADRRAVERWEGVVGDGATLRTEAWTLPSPGDDTLAGSADEPAEE